MARDVMADLALQATGRTRRKHLLLRPLIVLRPFMQHGEVPQP